MVSLAILVMCLSIIRAISVIYAISPTVGLYVIILFILHLDPPESSLLKIFWDVAISKTLCYLLFLSYHSYYLPNSMSYLRIYAPPPGPPESSLL